MASHRAVLPGGSPEIIELAPALVDREMLQAKPPPGSTRYYLVTRPVELALGKISMALSGRAGVAFFIDGPPGSGKTHFLNYVLALMQSGGSAEGVGGRELTIALDMDGGTGEFEQEILSAIAGALGNQRGALLWRQMGGETAVTVALNEARRLGVGALNLVIDLGATQVRPVSQYLAMLARLAGQVSKTRLLLVVAGRGDAPAELIRLDVAVTGKEQVSAGVARARRLLDGAAAPIEVLLGGTESQEARALFPLHEHSADLLSRLAKSNAGVGAFARVVREAIAAGDEARAGRRLLMPFDLMASAAAREWIDMRLGGAGRVALESARQAAAAVAPALRTRARRIVDTLALEAIAGLAPALSVGELERLLGGTAESIQAGTRQLLETLASRTHGVIRFDSDGACFDPRAGGAPEVAAFNEALPLTRKFDPTLGPARELPELQAKLKRLADGMADALDEANRVREALGRVGGGAESELASHRAALAGFLALVEAGPAALLEAAADSYRREAVTSTIDAYQALARAAAFVPRLRAMREYLRATGLEIAAEEEPATDNRLGALETECRLLLAALDPAAILNAPHNFDALQARFEKFKWTYVQHYRLAHERWRDEMERLERLLAGARQKLEALSRLDSIAVLGDPAGRELETGAAELVLRVRTCRFAGELATELIPVCADCGFVLGTPSPQDRLTRLLEDIAGALREKFQALSQSAVARLIREHDRAHRLDGFLKIIQAAQTDALVHVLDDELTAYLARLLEENAAPGGARESGRGTVERIDRRRPKAPKRPGGRSTHT